MKNIKKYGSSGSWKVANSNAMPAANNDKFCIAIFDIIEKINSDDLIEKSQKLPANLNSD